jgi:hypothetical protein
MSEIIRPGDTLMFVAPPNGDPTDRARIEARIAELLPGVIFAVTFGPIGATGLRIVAHYRPGSPAQP